VGRDRGDQFSRAAGRDGGDLRAAGFAIISFRDTSADIMPAQMRNRERLEREGLAPLGTHLIMGERLLEMQINSSRNLEDGKVATIEALVQKPG
jgi:hypothetical protein